MIKEYFANYFLHKSDVTFYMHTNTMEVHLKNAEPWEVTLVDTGEQTLTGGRLKRVMDYVSDSSFCFTYGDGLANVPIDLLINMHKACGKLATVTAVQPPGRYGLLDIGEAGAVKSFQEKVKGDGAWVNGGFFVLEPAIFDFIEGDNTIWEQEPLRRIAAEGQLQAYQHRGYWQPMDTLRDKVILEELWSSSKAPWKLW